MVEVKVNLLNNYALEGLSVLEEYGDERVNIDARNSVTNLR
jgi:hypothetical protein